MLDFYAGDHCALFPGTSISKRELTYELPDHFPLWVQTDTDTDAEALDQVLAPRR